MKNTFIIGELSANHNHDIELAKDSIRAFSHTGIDGIKIQTYTAETMTINSIRDEFRISQGTLWDGETLYNLYKKAYTPWEWHSELRDLAEGLGLVFFSTPFDHTAVDHLEKMGVPLYKIASFELVDIPLIEYTASKGKPMIMSTGIATEEEIKDAVEACRKVDNKDITLLHCVSSYPTQPEEFNLLTMVDLKERFGVKIGLSDHSIQNEASIAAVALGAEVIEKHIILDRELGGPDANFSMVPKEMETLVTSIRTVEEVIGKVDYSLSEKKIRNRHFARSLYVVKDIKKGDVFSIENVRSIRPGNGASPRYLPNIIGKVANKNIEKGTPFSLDMI